MSASTLAAYYKSLEQLEPFADIFGGDQKILIRYQGEFGKYNIPSNYADPLDLTYPIDFEAMGKVIRWINDENRKPWLYIWGDSGAGKSRAACIVALAFDGDSDWRFSGWAKTAPYKFVPMSKFMTATNTDKGQKFTELTTVSYCRNPLILDDIDKCNWTKSRVEKFGNFIRELDQGELCPMVFTSNLSHDRLEADMRRGVADKDGSANENLVDPTIRRFEEYCAFVEFKRSPNNG